MSGTLYVVATPIGHLGDLSARAVETLKTVEIIAAEDTRRTAALLAHLQHRAPQLLSMHEHNEAQVTPLLLRELQAGHDVAIVSDAGTPLLNDPGFAVVGAAYAADVRVEPIPGPSALATALSVCPLPSYPFLFVGFLPAKAGARRASLQSYVQRPEALAFFEAPHRMLATLGDLAALTQRPIMVARELTKRFETVLVGSAGEVAQQLGATPKGEFVCILAAERGLEGPGEALQLHGVLGVLLKEVGASQAAKIAAKLCGVSKSVAYEAALSLQDR